jgi:hypothetical protein
MTFFKKQKHRDPDPDANSEQWYIYIILQRQKVIKKLQNSRNQGFFLQFLLDDGRIRIRIRTCD